MKIIETGIYIPGETKGTVIYKGQRKAVDVFNELETILKEENIYPSEYILLNRDFYNKGSELIPVIGDMFCYTRWGGSEGIYIDIDIHSYDAEKHEDVITHFITAKSLEESTDAFDRMQYIAGCIYKIFNGNGMNHTRYIVIRTGEPKKNMDTLMAHLKTEAIEFMKHGLFHQGEEPSFEMADELALSMMIVNTIPTCCLSEDKLKELFEHENILAYLRDLCVSIMEPNKYDIKKILTSCSSFAKKED